MMKIENKYCNTCDSVVGCQTEHFMIKTLIECIFKIHCILVENRDAATREVGKPAEISGNTIYTLKYIPFSSKKLFVR